MALASVSAGNCITLTKALAMFIKLTLEGDNQLTHPFPYLILLFVLISVVLQLKCLNSAMENHKSYIVTALYFVVQIACTMVNASIVFGEMLNLQGKSFVFFGIGTLSIMQGVTMLYKETSKDGVLNSPIPRTKHYHPPQEVEGSPS